MSDFRQPLERDEKGLILWLAESYAAEDDGLTCRFTEVRWQDGAPLIAEDVAFSITCANRQGQNQGAPKYNSTLRYC